MTHMMLSDGVSWQPDSFEYVLFEENGARKQNSTTEECHLEPAVHVEAGSLLGLGLTTCSISGEELWEKSSERPSTLIRPTMVEIESGENLCVGGNEDLFKPIDVGEFLFHGDGASDGWRSGGELLEASEKKYRRSRTLDMYTTNLPQNNKDNTENENDQASQHASMTHVNDLAAFGTGDSLQNTVADRALFAIGDFQTDLNTQNSLLELDQLAYSKFTVEIGTENSMRRIDKCSPPSQPDIPKLPSSFRRSHDGMHQKEPNNLLLERVAKSKTNSIEPQNILEENDAIPKIYEVPHLGNILGDRQNGSMAELSTEISNCKQVDEKGPGESKKDADYSFEKLEISKFERTVIQPRKSTERLCNGALDPSRQRNIIEPRIFQSTDIKLGLPFNDQANGIVTVEEEVKDIELLKEAANPIGSKRLVSDIDSSAGSVSDWTVPSASQKKQRQRKAPNNRQVKQEEAGRLKCIFPGRQKTMKAAREIKVGERDSRCFVPEDFNAQKIYCKKESEVSDQMGMHDKSSQDSHGHICDSKQSISKQTSRSSRSLRKRTSSSSMYSKFDFITYEDDAYDEAIEQLEPDREWMRARGKECMVGNNSCSHSHSTVKAASRKCPSKSNSIQKTAVRSRAGKRTVPLAAQRIRATSARHEMKGRPSFAEIVETGFMQPGIHQFHVGSAEVSAAVGEDGAIIYEGIRYRAISKFALVVLRERNPSRQSCDGWKEVTLNGEKLDALRLRVQQAQCINDEQIS